MDGIANVARQQQSQVNATEMQGRAQMHTQQTHHSSETQLNMKQEDPIKELQDKSMDGNHKINSKEKVEDLVTKLNNALGPITTSIQFGVDKQDVFYVSVLDAKTNRMLRRYPAEQAQEFLPKMQEVGGILFDSKG